VSRLPWAVGVFSCDAENVIGATREEYQHQARRCRCLRSRV